MGRELRRVPLDFEWPMNKVWEGYLNPGYRKCPSADCDNGSTLAGRWLECVAHLLLMVGEAGIENRELHPWLDAIPLRPARRPGPQAAELSGGLAGRPPRVPFGHDAMDRWAATKAIVAAAGLSEDWGICPVCKGSAIHPDDYEAHEAWEGTDPPEGDGYQLWETTSEGSPISPVFATLDELCTYAADNCSVFGGVFTTADRWREMLDDGLVVHREGNNIFL
jgi:hypothetical protein